MVQAVENYDYSAIPAQELDAIRLKLSQLTSSLNKIKNDISKPIVGYQQWHSLSAKLTLLLSQLSSLNSTLQHYEYVLNALIVYPLPSFPTTAHENLLTTLLRKKNIPEVDDWIANAMECGSNSNKNNVKEVIQKDIEISNWCLSTLKSERLKIFNKSRENVDDEDNEDDDIGEINSQGNKRDVFKIVAPPFDVNNVLKFMYTGSTA